MSIATAHVVVKGHVQGIGFRHFVKETACDFEMTGSVENHSDGDVEIVAIGERAVVEQFLATVEKGNGFSIIEHFHIKWKEGGHVTGEFNITKATLW